MSFSSHDELSVHYQIYPIDYDSKHAVESVQYFDVEKESEKSEQNKRHHEYKEYSATDSEVGLGGHSIDSEGESDPSCHYGCHDHNFRIVGGTDSTHNVREGDTEDKKQNIIGRDTSSQILATNDSEAEYKVDSKRGPEEPGILNLPFCISVRSESRNAHEDSNSEHNCENPINLSNEAKSDLRVIFVVVFVLVHFNIINKRN